MVLRHTDVRSDIGIADEVSRFIDGHGAESIVLADRIIGCPHEDGVDYPDGTACPKCAFLGEPRSGVGRAASLNGRAHHIAAG